MNLKEALCQANRDLGNFREAEVLLESCLNLGRLNFYLNPDRTLTHQEWKLLQEAIEKRKKRLPLAYIIRKKEFYSLEFGVTQDTFIPRPETEFLVDAVLNLSRSQVAGRKSQVALKTTSDKAKQATGNGQRAASDEQRATGNGQQATSDELIIIDLGTGCGNIAITLAKYIPNSRIYATDISKKALEVAQENAKRHGVEDRMTFLTGDLFSPLTDYRLEGKIDFLVSNPPYIMRREIDYLMPEVANYEPHIALDGGGDGLSFHRRIIKEAPQYLKSPEGKPSASYGTGKGYLVLELGIGQAPRAKEMIEKTLAFEFIEIIKDYSGIERVIIAQRQ